MSGNALSQHSALPSTCKLNGVTTDIFRWERGLQEKYRQKKAGATRIEGHPLK